MNREQNLENWRQFQYTSGGMIAQTLFPKGSEPARRAILHDNLAAIDRYLENQMVNPYEDFSISVVGGLKDIPQDDTRFVGRRVLYHDNNSKRDFEILYISTAIGAPNTAIVVHELKAFGIEKIIKVGTASALDNKLEEGHVLVPAWAVADEGTSKWNDFSYMTGIKNMYKYFKRVQAYASDTGLRNRLREILRQAQHANATSNLGPHDQDDVAVWSVDSYPTFIICTDLYEPPKFKVGPYKVNKSKVRLRLLGVEMECSALFSSAKMINIAAAALIVVSRTREQMATPVRGEGAVRNKDRVQGAELVCMDVATRSII